MYRPVCVAAGMFIAGIVLGSKASLPIIIVSVIYSVFIYKNQKRTLKYLFLSMVLSMIFIFSFVLGCNSGKKIYEKTGIEIFVSEYLKYDSNDCYVRGVVKNINKTENGIRIKLLINSLSENHDSEFYPENKEYMFVYCNDFYVDYNDTIEIFTEIKLYENAMNEGGFNAYDYYRTRNISGYAYPTELKIISEFDGFSVGKVLDSFKNVLIDGIYSSFNDDEGGMIIAILTGEKAYIDDDINNLYRDTGFAHILAISGLHISIIGLGLFNFVRKKELGYIPSTVLTMLILIVYNSFSGGQVSCKRAIIMICVSLIARCIGRKYDKYTAISLAAVIILLNQPGYIYDCSFLMSFSAGIGIAVFGDNLDKCEILEEKGKKKKIKNVLFTLGMQIALMPLQVQFFNKICPYSIIINLILLPFVPVIVLFGFLAGVIGYFLPVLGMIVGFPAKIVIKVYELVLGITSNLPYSEIVTGHMTPLKWIIFAMIILSFIIIMSEKKTVHAFWCLIPSVFLIIPFKSNDLNITQLYVGQGDCCIITCNETAIAVDCGSSDEKELYKYTIEPYLNYYGYDKLDYVFLSHSDTDHVSGIVEYYESNSDIKETEMTCIVPDLEDVGSFENILPCGFTNVRCFEKVNIGDMVFTCVYPDNSNNSVSDNEASMVLHMNYGDFSMLFTGDIGEQNEMQALDNLKKTGLDNDVDVLKVAHHGSNYSSSEEFISAITPEIALISCGKDNMYGHPGEDAVDRLKDCGSKVYVTKDCGRIRVRTGKTNGNLSYTVDTYK